MATRTVIIQPVDKNKDNEYDCHLRKGFPLGETTGNNRITLLYGKNSDKGHHKIAKDDDEYHPPFYIIHPGEYNECRRY